jgi:hypothetical protein
VPCSAAMPAFKRSEEQQRVALLRLGLGRTLPYWVKAVGSCLSRLIPAHAAYPPLRRNVDTIEGQDACEAWQMSTDFDSHVLLIAANHVRQLAVRAQGLSPSANAFLRLPCSSTLKMYGAFSNILIGTGSSTTGTPKKGIVGKNLATGLEYTEHDLLFHAGDRVVRRSDAQDLPTSAPLNLDLVKLRLVAGRLP